MPPFYDRWWFWMYAVCWAPYTLCLAFYGLRSPWRRSAVGRGLFTLYGALVAILTLVLVVQLAPLPLSVEIALRVVTLTAVAVAGVIQLANILRLQRRDPADPQRRDSDR